MENTQKPPRDNLFRAHGNAPTLERADGSEMPTMVVEWVRYNEWTTIASSWEGTFLERVAPGAMDKTIAESRDSMRVLFDHGHDPSIGNKVLGPIANIESDEVGARGYVPLFPTEYNKELLPGLEAGVYGASFRFQVMKEDFTQKPKRSDYNPQGLPERTITEAKVREWGPVTFPAYPGATAGLRSITDEVMLGRLLDDPDRLRELLEAFQQRTTVTVTIPTDLESEPSAATTPVPDPEPEPSAATTRQKRTPGAPVSLYPYREDTESWRL